MVKITVRAQVPIQAIEAYFCGAVWGGIIMYPLPPPCPSARTCTCTCTLLELVLVHVLVLLLVLVFVVVIDNRQV